MIGHASLGSNGKTTGDKAGDQGREVTTTSYYKKNWTYVLRPKDKNIAEQIATQCEKGCANQAIGYNQQKRNSLRTQAKLVGMQLDRIVTDCDCDCSSFMSVCCECVGIPIPYNGNNAPTTSSMRTAFMNTGYFDLLTDKKYLDSDNYLCRGDILVSVGNHTVMVLSNGKLADIAQLETIQTNQIKAIDLSKYNIITDYKVMAQQIQYVFIRVGYRGSTSGQIIEDDLFKKHIENCISNGIKNIGCYFYDQSLNEKEAVEQAEWVLEKIKPYSEKINLPIYIDSEYSNGTTHNGRADNISKDQRTKNIIAFCNTISDAGKISGCYASDSWYKSMVNFDQIKNYSIWCARYSTQKPDISKYDIWQYGSEQFIWGQKPIDVNWIYNLSTNTQKLENGANKKEIKGINNIVKVSDYLNIRNQPLSNAQIVGKLYLNDKVNIYGYVHDWYMISKTMDKWVSAKYVFTNMGKTTANLNYRTGVGTQNKSLGVYEKGTVVKLLNKETYNGETWYLCLDSKDRFGWCSGKYIE